MKCLRSRKLTNRAAEDSSSCRPDASPRNRILPVGRLGPCSLRMLLSRGNFLRTETSKIALRGLEKR
jgi:hypothetical protein